MHIVRRHAEANEIMSKPAEIDIKACFHTLFEQNQDMIDEIYNLRKSTSHRLQDIVLAQDLLRADLQHFCTEYMKELKMLKTDPSQGMEQVNNKLAKLETEHGIIHKEIVRVNQSIESRAITSNKEYVVNSSHTRTDRINRKYN